MIISRILLKPWQVLLIEKDNTPFTHSRNTAKLARSICKKLGLNEKTTDLIYYAGLLQNIGKITLSEKILQQTENFPPKGLQKIKNHTNIGCKLTYEHKLLIRSCAIYNLSNRKS